MINDDLVEADGNEDGREGLVRALSGQITWKHFSELNSGKATFTAKSVVLSY